MKIAFLILILFGGYAIGRIGHILGGHLNTHHHWIYGILAITAGGLFFSHWFGVYLTMFGIGHTISDLRDMLDLKFYGPDPPGEKKFWGID